MIKYVNGVAVEMTAKEIAQRQAEEQAVLAKQAADSIKGQIITLEAQITSRRLREAILTEEGKIWLENKEAEIETLRAQL